MWRHEQRRLRLFIWFPGSIEPSKSDPAYSASMSRYMQYYLPLNKSTLVFFPPSSNSHSSSVSQMENNGHRDGYVVQVMIKSAQ